MRYLLFILAFPLLVQADTQEQQCNRLKTIASGLEKQIQSTIIGKSCTDLPASGITGFDYRCKDLASVEMQLKSVDNEIAMFKGVNILRDETIVAKKTLEESPNKAAAIDASQNLYKNLKVASAIESLLLVKGIKGENLLSLLAKGSDEELNNVDKFKALISKTCEKIGVTPEAKAFCDSPSLVDEDVLKEINGLLVLGKKTERKFDKGQIEDLKEAIAIRDGEKEYSFTKMLSEVTAPAANEAFSEKDQQTLTTIKINVKGDKYAFLKNLREASSALDKTKSLSKAQALPVRFQDLFDSLKRREEWELKSKLSAVLNEIKDSIPDSAKAACAQARTLTGEPEACLNALIEKLDKGSKRQNSAADILLELKYGMNHIKKLDQLMLDCAPNTEDMSLLAECSKYLDKNTKDLEAKSVHLKAVRAKLLEGVGNLMLSRDVAVEAIHQKNCMSAAVVKINCEKPIGEISSEVTALSDAAGEIVLLFNTPEAGKDLATQCKAPPKDATHMEEICKLAQKDTPKVTRTPTGGFDPTDPVEGVRSNRSSAGQPWADLLGTLGQAAGTFFAPKQQFMNPYASMFPYTQTIGQPRDIKNQIMDPYMVTGFGAYAPTVGLRPFSSVNSNVGTSSAYSFGSSTFFNSPVGW